MASTNKTETLLLNQWLGNDISAREDFNSDNKKIDDWAKTVTTQLKENTQNFNELNKRILSNGNKNYYVSTAGNDVTGDGSQEKPFKTIQKAFDMIPRLVTNIFTIEILDGTYDGFNLYSITGSGLIIIKSNSGNRDNVIISHAEFNHCYIQVLLEGVTINTTSRHKITSYGCSRLEIKNCKLESASTNDGVIAEYSNCYLHDTLISNQQTAIKSIVAGFILAQNCSGSGNGTALSAIYGGVLAKDNNTITGTTQENSGIGGVIR